MSESKCMDKLLEEGFECILEIERLLCLVDLKLKNGFTGV